jgi:hypothetical protein
MASGRSRGRGVSVATVGYPERRRKARQTTLYRVGVLHTARRPRLCVIRNISSTGMKARINGAIETGEAVAVEIVSDRRIPGRIVWSADGGFGMDFDREVDIREALALPERPGRPPRRSPRLPVDCMAMVRVGADMIFVTATHLSPGGVRLSPADRLAEGMEVGVMIEGLEPLRGVVRWCDGEGCGVAFLEPVAVPRLARWLDEAG